jgi:hypothetical protein
MAADERATDYRVVERAVQSFLHIARIEKRPYNRARARALSGGSLYYLHSVWLFV